MTKKLKKSIRLPDYISPIRYYITLAPDLLSFTFNGKEIIDIKINKEVKQITIHSKDIDIETVEYIYKKDQQFANKISYDTEKETATFHFKKSIKKGVGKLSIVFSGVINDNLRGFYKSKYVLDGETKHIATTQFEATDARRAFPCFDEPAQKAIFEISLVVPNSHTAISNTLPINIREHNSEYKVVSFAPSPKMSTYLLAFIIGEFEYIEGYTKNKIQVRVFTIPGKKHQAQFALDVAIRSLEFFTDYFDIPYPMLNLDLITIQDFESAAMENWGAITFRESSILIDEDHSSLTNKQWVATTVAHEIAHQWFGNLVTMHWWTDLWLNEGFASYMEKVCTDKLFPHWRVWDLYLATSRYRNAIEIDSLKNSHPIEVELYHPNEISETFDMVSYEKGTAIVRMLCEYIGENKFREGLSYYLKKHSYKNTKTINLWEAFEKVSKKPVKNIMNSWTKQAGFPLVSISQKQGHLELRQERFFSSRITKKDNKKNTLWKIPVIYKTNDKNKKILLDKKTLKISESKIQKLNKDEASFIKVNYDIEILKYLSEKIKNNHIGVIDRLGIVRDIFALAESGHIKTDKALEFVLSYKNETNYMVWSEIAYGFNKIDNLISDEGIRNKYKKYALSFFSPLVEKIGFNKKPNEESSDTLLRSLAISQAAFYGDKNVIRESQKIFANKIFKPIDPDMRGIIYNIVAQNGKTKEWMMFKNLYKEEALQEEKERLAKAMTQFKDKNLLEKTLHFAISKEVRNNFAPFLIASTWNNKEGQNLTWKFLKNNWGLILKKYGEAGLLLSKFVYILGNHTTKEDLIDAKKFFSKNIAPSAERTVKQAYERIESNVAWIKDDVRDLEKWLNTNY